MKQKEKMYTWELTNENGQTISLRANDISDMPVAFGIDDGGLFPVVLVKRIA